MKHPKKIIGVIAAVMLLACFVAIPVMAQPPTPCAFSGDVTLDGQPCVGAIITVKLADDTLVVTEPPVVDVKSGSIYAVVIPQDPITERPAQGEPLNFFVNGFFARQGTWTSQAMKTLDLEAFTEEVPPTVATMTPLNVTDTSARIRGNLTHLGTAATVSVYFEYGNTPDVQNTTGESDLTSPDMFWWDWTGLSPDTTYYFRAVAEGDGTAYGSVVSFTTLEEYEEPVHPPAGTFARWLYEQFIEPLEG